MLDFIHENLTYDRRINTLATQISEHLDAGAEILDIGCGDGQISELILSKVEGASIAGIDVMERSIANISVTKYDGLTIPLEDNSVDTCVFVDVLHHAEQPLRVMQEAGRVARKSVIIKDHLADGFLSWQILRFMDWVGNERHGVSLPYNYFKEQEWLDYFAQLEWNIDSWETDLNIYPLWCSWAFDRKLHFIAKLQVSET
jgi:SAM-dependent methyltransferase